MFLMLVHSAAARTVSISRLKYDRFKCDLNKLNHQKSKLCKYTVTQVGSDGFLQL